ncbi:uncharacterized protein LOC119889414 [Micropterus salmoides]|uniref:uncharacterized protein LOC119889414 n=1 Tax=Micropterus salmoides TaxID=27706 RepID=UPI0018EDCB31|nr:uncharacterized protein LOC119889414 [Micropterus salmoides]
MDRHILSLKGNTQKMTDYNVVQWPTVSDPVHPGDAVTLQCSVLSTSKKKSCPGEHSVHWFGVRSDKYHANTIYTGGNRHHECDKRPDAQSPPKSCVYHLSKNVSSSDAGIYYCAVAACGEIIFGNGTKLDIESGTSLRSVLQMDNIILLLLCATSAISLIVIAILIYVNKKNKCDYCSNEADVSLQEYFAKRNLKRDEETWIYSAALFTTMQTGTGGRSDAKAVERERIYAAVKAFGLN